MTFHNLRKLQARRRIISLAGFVALIAAMPMFAPGHYALHGQTAENPIIVENIHKYGFRGVKSIVNKTSGQVIGHYLFYREGGSLCIEFLSTDLSPVTKERLPISADTEINEAVFNGSDIMFTAVTRHGAEWFSEISYNATVYIYTYTPQGEKLGSKSLSYTVSGNIDLAIYPGQADGSFYIVCPTSSSFYVEKLDRSLKTIWRKDMRHGSGYASCEAVFPGQDRLALVVKRKPKLMSKVAAAHLVCLDDITGNELFDTPLNDKKHTAIPSQVLIDADKNIVAAGDYYRGRKERSIKSKGIAVRKISPIGEDIYFSLYKWRRNIKRQMRKSKATLSLNNKVLFHSLEAAPGGGYRLIGESFSTSQVGGVIGNLDRGPSAIIASQSENGQLVYDIMNLAAQAQRLKAFITAAASGRYIGYAHPIFSPGTLTVQDLVIFNFADDLSLRRISKIDKPNFTKVFTYHPFDLYGGLRKAKTVADFGFFDYSFSSSDMYAGQEAIVYSAAFSMKPHIGIVSLENGQPADTKRIYFKELTGKKNAGKWGNAGCAPAADGKILIYYFVSGQDEPGNRETSDNTGTLYFYLENLYSAE
jgi:hypothetical protein